jgi:hypothetical protein
MTVKMVVPAREAEIKSGFEPNMEAHRSSRTLFDKNVFKYELKSTSIRSRSK